MLFPKADIGWLIGDCWGYWYWLWGGCWYWLDGGGRLLIITGSAKRGYEF